MNSRTRRRSSSQKRPWFRVGLWAFGILLGVGVLGVVLGKMWVDSYLRSDAFRRFVSDQSTARLHAQGEFAPFELSGMSFFTDSFVAQGQEAATFSGLRIEQIRAEVSTRRFFDGVWVIDQVSAERAEVRLGGPRLAPQDPQPASQPDRQGASQQASQEVAAGGWLPNRVVIGSAVVREATLALDAASALRGTQLHLTSEDSSGNSESWQIEARGGRLEAFGLSSLELDSLQARYRPPALFLQNAKFRQSSGGTVEASGELRLKESVDLQVALAGVSVTPLLPEDWRARLHGKLDGEVQIRGPLLPGPKIRGKLSLSNGQLEALPVLDKISDFTRLQQFRKLAISRASADFVQENGTLTIKNFFAESRGLLRIEGEMTVKNEHMEGNFQVGVVASSLQWLPGSQERVFTQARDGYLWAPMRLSGPLSGPSEDLSARLAEAEVDSKVAAVKGAAVDFAPGATKETVRDALDLSEKAAKEVLKFVPLFK